MFIDNEAYFFLQETNSSKWFCDILDRSAPTAYKQARWFDIKTVLVQCAFNVRYWVMLGYSEQKLQNTLADTRVERPHDSQVCSNVD